VCIISLESAKAYVERMKTDEDFRKKVFECKDNKTRKNFVLKEGFDFAVDDLKKLSGELSEEELERVAGGACYITESSCGQHPIIGR